MKLATRVLVASVLGLGTLSVYLYSALDAAHGQMSVQAGALRDLQANIGSLQGECIALQPRAGLGDQWQFGTVDHRGLAVDAGLEIAGTRQGDHDLASRRGGHEIPRAVPRAALRALYGGLRDELSLAPEQEAAVMNLLLEQRLQLAAAASALAGDPASMRRTLDELRREDEVELMALLGDKYSKFEGYEKTLPERMQIEQAALQLEAADVPLRSDQRHALIAAMSEERESIPQPVWIVGAPAEEQTALQREWQEGYQQRVRKRASGLLTSEQLRQYDVFLKLQTAMRRSLTGGT